MKLDLRRPTFVFLGNWNPAVFQPGWIAHYVFGFPIGADITAVSMMEQEPEPAIIFYFDQVGVSATATRLRVFANSFDQQVRTQTENAAIAIVKALPHTPTAQYGINFAFIDDDPSPDLIDKLQSTDGIEAKFTVTRQRFVTAASLPDGPTLNFARQRESGSVKMDLNFHFPDFNAGDVEQKIVGSINQRYEQSLEILEDLYELEQDGVLAHTFGPDGG